LTNVTNLLMERSRHQRQTTEVHVWTTSPEWSEIQQGVEPTTQLSHWCHSVSISRHGSSASRIQISSSDLSSRLSNCVV